MKILVKFIILIFYFFPIISKADNIYDFEIEISIGDSALLFIPKSYE